MIKQLLFQYRNNQLFKQAFGLYTVNIISIPLSIISSVIITRFLGPSSYGDFKFLFNVFNLAIVIFSFGLFQAGNRALVLNKDSQKAKEIYGVELLVVLVLFVGMSLFLLGYAFFDKNINEKGLHNLLIYLIPFSWVFLLVQYFEVLFQADNKIKLLAYSRLYPKLAFFLSVLLIYLFFFNYSGNKIVMVWAAFFVTQIIVFLYIIYKINPSFRNLKTRISEILLFNRTYGFHVYIGSVFSIGFSQLTGVLISYFANNNKGVGYYALAMTIAGPLSFIPNVIATTHYKDFADRTSIPRKLILITISISFSALVFILIIVGPFISLFYGHKFAEVTSLTYIVSFGVILSGLADFLNRFLGSHGKGKALRNSSIIVGISLLILNVLLIPLFGETGAAYTSLLSGLIYFLCMFWFYKRLVTELKNR
ncbi:MAG TPA: oligosaccharide flippase family protein [Hanamia sp.]|nr:oligosaccharide flippase family protein [Hanamia sp.]